MSDDFVEDVIGRSKGSMRSGDRLGKKPTKEEIKKEVQRLNKKGMEPKDIGKQIGVYYTMKKDKETLDKLEEVLTNKFESYGKKSEEVL